MSSIFEKLVLHSPHLSTKQFIPAFLYGTAWKKQATADLVYQAICNGFTAIDTAAQPKHYREDLVAAGLSRAIQESKVKRSDIYLQTKFTSVHGQDPTNMPYDQEATLAEQVNASVLSSLRNFNFAHIIGKDEIDSPYIDTLVLHSPMPTVNETLEVWNTLEQYVPGDIRNLGISNCDLFMLMELYERSNIKPVVVQNRFHAATKYDIALRKFCQEKGIIYQSFWTLTANLSMLRSPAVTTLAEEIKISPEAALYCLVLGLGNTVILNGTKSLSHMQNDLEALSLTRKFAAANPRVWEVTMDTFRELTGQSRR